MRVGVEYDRFGLRSGCNVSHAHENEFQTECTQSMRVNISLGSNVTFGIRVLAC